jgi:hypothetical protein
MVKLHPRPDYLVRVIDVKIDKNTKQASLENIRMLPYKYEPKNTVADASMRNTNHIITYDTEPTNRRWTAPRIWLRTPGSEKVWTLVDNIGKPNERGTDSTEDLPTKRRKFNSGQKLGLFSTLLFEIFFSSPAY